MTITRIGTNEKYQAGWASAFGGKKPAAKTAKAAAKPAPSKKKAAAKKTAKKSSKK